MHSILPEIGFAILAATALPKFSDLSKDARLASLKGAMGAVKSAAGLAHGTALAQGLGAASAVSMEGVNNVAMSNYYPTVAGITTAANLSANDYTLNTAGTVLTVQAKGASLPGSCQFTYTEAGVGGAPVVSGIPATNTNC